MTLYLTEISKVKTTLYLQVHRSFPSNFIRINSFQIIFMLVILQFKVHSVASEIKKIWRWLNDLPPINFCRNKNPTCRFWLKYHRGLELKTILGPLTSYILISDIFTILNFVKSEFYPYIHSALLILAVLHKIGIHYACINIILVIWKILK